MNPGSTESPAPDIDPVLRPMIREDIDEVMALELKCYPHPWTKGIFADCIRVGFDC